VPEGGAKLEKDKIKRRSKELKFKNDKLYRLVGDGGKRQIHHHMKESASSTIGTVLGGFWCKTHLVTDGAPLLVERHG
jgi:hypothetical protein